MPSPAVVAKGKGKGPAPAAAKEEEPEVVDEVLTRHLVFPNPMMGEEGACVELSFRGRKQMHAALATQHARAQNRVAAHTSFVCIALILIKRAVVSFVFLVQLTTGVGQRWG